MTYGRIKLAKRHFNMTLGKSFGRMTLGRMTFGIMKLGSVRFDRKTIVSTTFGGMTSGNRHLAE